MILKASIKNFLGIRNFEIDFTQSHVYGKDQGEQVLSYEKNTHYSLVPTFLAKNASGKTSFIKAISFGLTFSNSKEFVKEIAHYINSTIRSFIGNRIKKSIDTKINLANLKSELISEPVSILFKELSHIGSKLIEIEIDLIGNRKIKLSISNDSFFVTLNETKINISQFINQVILKVIKDGDYQENEDIGNLITMRDSVYQVTKKFAKKFNFYKDVNFNSIFRDTLRKTTASEILIKHQTDKYIFDLVNNVGFHSVSTLLTKMDENITKVAFDIEKKDINIFTKDSYLPVTGKNLSFGTQKVLEIIHKSMPLFKNGGVMLIDEIENGLHLSLINLVVSLFEDENINKQKAQLFLTTHNPLIFEHKIVLPSNCYMTEKGNFKSLKFFTNRTADFEKLTKSKNYYNDLLWLLENKEPRTSIPQIKTRQILNAIQEDLDGKNKHLGNF